MSASTCIRCFLARAASAEVRFPVFVRNMVFFELFLCCFSLLSVLFYPPHSFLSVSLLKRQDNTRAFDFKDVAKHNVQLQRTTRFQRYLRGLASGWYYRSISPLLPLAISPSRTSPSSPDRGIWRSRRYPPPTFAGPLSWPAAIQRSANRPKSSTKEWYLGRSVTVAGPIVS